MKKIFAFLVLAASALSAHADIGPYYIYYSGFCNIKEIYVNQYGDFYGREIGCSASAGSPIVGGIDPVSGNANASIYASGGRVCFQVYRPDSQLRGGCSDGGQFSYFDPILYIFTDRLTRSSAKAAPGQSELPSIYD